MSAIFSRASMWSLSTHDTRMEVVKAVYVILGSDSGDAILKEPQHQAQHTHQVDFNPLHAENNIWVV